ncbi:diacylglycerol pyrophosphate phosphatase [Pseudoscourfieldia marina]
MAPASPSSASASASASAPRVAIQLEVARGGAQETRGDGHSSVRTVPISILVTSVGLAVTVLASTHPAQRFPLTPTNAANYDFPFKGDHETVPYVAVVVLGIVAVVACAVAEGLLQRKGSRIKQTNGRCAAVLDALRSPAAHVLVYGLDAAILTGLVTQALKDYVGEPRPDYLARCAYVDKTVPSWSACETQEALDSDIVVRDGRRSFPSGHASTAAVFGVFLAGYWAMRIATPDVRLAAVRVLRAPDWVHEFVGVALDLFPALPLFAACYIAASRVADFRHSPGDVAMGFLLGAAFAAHGLARVARLASPRTCLEEESQRLINNDVDVV